MNLPAQALPRAFLGSKASGPIGVFDSGIGGLTVLAAIHRRLPHESLLYLADTARLPYGNKEPGTIVRYAERAARYLLDQGAKVLVVACNTATANAVDHLRRTFRGTPVIGVVGPGAHAACSATKTGRIVVAATEGTVRSGVYERAIRVLRPDARVRAISCPMFVHLVEEGVVDGHVAESVVEHYLGEVLRDPPDVVVLACTHFPLLAPPIRRLLGPQIALVDGAEATAVAVERILGRHGLHSPVHGAPRKIRFMITDSAHRFTRSVSTLFPDLAGHGPAHEVEI